MLLQIPFQFDAQVQNVVLVLNTALLAVLLIFLEIFFSGAGKKAREQLVYFYPIVVVLAGILVYAMYVQLGHA